MKTSIKSIHSIKVTSLIRTLSVCLVVVALSFAAIPTRAGDAEDKANKAFADWKAANKAVADAKDNLEKARKKQQIEMDAARARKKKKKKDDAQDKQLEDARAEVAAAEAALEKAEAALVAARIALEKAIVELPNGPLKDQLKRERNFPSLVTANGLHTVKFDTPSGQLTVNLPDDTRAGDTISGTVIAEPKGQTPEERTKSAVAMRDDVVAFFAADPTQPKAPPVVIFDLSKGLPQPGGSTIVTQTFTAPKKVNVGLFLMPNQNSPIGACGRSGSLVAINESCSPISQLVFTSPDQGTITPDPKITPTFTIPPLGQTGRPVVITGPFDGNSSNTTLNWSALRTSVQDFEKNTENVSGGFGLLAESPGKAVFESPKNVTGPIQITLNEGNTQTTGTYRNVGVNLTAPKTSLLKGERTTLTVQVSGLQGIKEPVPLTLESRGVITMEGGTYQPLVIQPSQVGADGRYSTTRGITGVQTGVWGATATVVTNQQPATNPPPTKLRTFPGDYGNREGDTCEHGGKIVWRRHQTYNCVVKEISQVECGETKAGKDLVKDLEGFVKEHGKEWGKALLSKATAAAGAIKAVVTIYRTSDLYIHVVRPWEDVDITYECRGGVWVSTGSKVVASGEDDLGWHKLMVPHGDGSLCWAGTESVAELREAVDTAFGAVCPGEALIVK